MQIFCDESGGTDPANALFLVAAVRIDGTAATRLVKAFRTTAGHSGELKGFRLTLPQRQLFFDLLLKTEGLAVAVVCDRREPAGGWAMGVLPETDVYEHLLGNACCSLPPLGGPATVTADGGRYKRAFYGELISRLVPTIGAHHQGRSSLLFANSAASSGIQVADVVANTVFHARGPDDGAEQAQVLLQRLIDDGRLTIASAQFDGVRPSWLP